MISPNGVRITVSTTPFSGFRGFSKTFVRLRASIAGVVKLDPLQVAPLVRWRRLWLEIRNRDYAGTRLVTKQEDSNPLGIHSWQIWETA